MRKCLIFLSLIFAFVYIGAIGAEMPKVEVLSEGDRSLALDWILPMESSSQVYVRKIVHDEDGNIYILGNYKKYLKIGNDVNLPVKNYNGSNNLYFMKYSKTGELLWINDISTASASNSSLLADNLWLNPDGDIVVLFDCANLNTHERDVIEIKRISCFN